MHSSESFSAWNTHDFAGERRLCRKQGGAVPGVSMEIDHEVERRQMVLSTGSAFDRLVMEKMETKAKEPGWLERFRGKEKTPEAAYRQLLDEDAWLSVFQFNFDAPSVPTESGEIVLSLWSVLSPKERADLLRLFVEEHFGRDGDELLRDAELTQAYRSLKAVKTEEDLKTASKGARLLVTLRRAQRGSARTRDDFNAKRHQWNHSELGDKQWDVVRQSAYHRYITQGKLTHRAYSEFLNLLSTNRDACDAVNALPEYTNTELWRVALALPESTLRGAFVTGAVDLEHLGELARLYRSREEERTQMQGQVKQSLAKYRSELEQQSPAIAQAGKEAPAQTAATPEFFSDSVIGKFKEGWGKLNGWQKILFGAAGLYVGWKVVSKLGRMALWGGDGKDKASGWVYRAGALLGLGLGAYALGGDKLLHGLTGGKGVSEIGSDMWSWTRKGGAEAATQGKGNRDLSMRFAERLAEDGQEDFGPVAILGEMPLSMVAAGFTLKESEKSGVITVTKEMRAFIARRIPDKDLAEKIIRRIDGRGVGSEKWGGPLSHVFYLYGLHKCPRALEYQQSHVRVVEPALQRLTGSVDRSDPFAFLNHYDQINNPQAKSLYRQVVADAWQHAIDAGESMSLAAFLASVGGLEQTERPNESLPPVPDGYMLAKVPEGFSLVPLPRGYSSRELDPVFLTSYPGYDIPPGYALVERRKDTMRVAGLRLLPEAAVGGPNLKRTGNVAHVPKEWLPAKFVSPYKSASKIPNHVDIPLSAMGSTPPYPRHKGASGLIAFPKDKLGARQPDGTWVGEVGDKVIYAVPRSLLTGMENMPQPTDIIGRHVVVSLGEVGGHFYTLDDRMKALMVPTTNVGPNLPNGYAFEGTDTVWVPKETVPEAARGAKINEKDGKLQMPTRPGHIPVWVEEGKTLLPSKGEGLVPVIFEKGSAPIAVPPDYTPVPLEPNTVPMHVPEGWTYVREPQGWELARAPEGYRAPRYTIDPPQGYMYVKRPDAKTFRLPAGNYEVVPKNPRPDRSGPPISADIAPPVMPEAEVAPEAEAIPMPEVEEEGEVSAPDAGPVDATPPDALPDAGPARAA